MITNGRHPAAGNSLLGALAYYGLAGIAQAEKKQLRDRIIAGPPFTPAERLEILDYCESDVDALAALLVAMEPEISGNAGPLQSGAPARPLRLRDRRPWNCAACRSTPTFCATCAPTGRASRRC